MHYRIPWRRALLISCLMHCLLLSGVGWLAARVFVASEEAEYVELELISDAVIQEQFVERNPIAASKPDINQSYNVSAPVASTTMTAAIAADNSDVVEEAAAVSTAAVAVSASSSPAISAGSFGQARSRPRSISPPRILQKMEPLYPEQARREGVEGNVSVKMEILETGQIGSISLQRSSGNAALDEAALNTVRRWLFVPAKDAETGRAVRCFTTLAVEFRLH